jgi:hypothetical protein
MSDRRIEFSRSPDRDVAPRRRRPTEEWVVEEPTRPGVAVPSDDEAKADLRSRRGL